LGYNQKTRDDQKAVTNHKLHESRIDGALFPNDDTGPPTAVDAEDDEEDDEEEDEDEDDERKGKSKRTRTMTGKRMKMKMRTNQEEDEEEEEGEDVGADMAGRRVPLTQRSFFTTLKLNFKGHMGMFLCIARSRQTQGGKKRQKTRGRQSQQQTDSRAISTRSSRLCMNAN
jgi:hypothetical protein